jgi:hypothetical protein
MLRCICGELDLSRRARRASLGFSARGLARWGHADLQEPTTVGIIAAGLTCLRAMRTAAGNPARPARLASDRMGAGAGCPGAVSIRGRPVGTCDPWAAGGVRVSIMP